MSENLSVRFLPNSLFTPDWRSGKAVATRIARADGEIIGIAGLWEQWRDPGTGETVHSFTMLTLNADEPVHAPLPQAPG